MELTLVRCTQCCAPLNITGEPYVICAYCGSTIELTYHKKRVEQEVIATPWSVYGDSHNILGELLIPIAEGPVALPGNCMFRHYRHPHKSVYVGHFVEGCVENFDYVQHATRSDRILGVAIETDFLMQTVDVVILGRVSGFIGLTPGHVYAKGVIAVSETVMHIGA